MGWLIVIACTLAGLAAGSLAGGDGSATGLCTGLVFGLVLVKLRSLSARIDALQAQLAALRTPPAARAAAPAITPALAASPMPDIELDAPAPPPTPAPRPTPYGPAAPPVAARTPAPAAAADPDPLARALAAVKRWFTEGNVPVKVGMLVLIAGIAALLKYASDEGWLRLPVEWRMAGIALAAMAALVFGWRERTRRRSFGVAVQGGAIGVLLLTVFAAFRLYSLLPAPAAFGLLVVLVGGACLLAVLQDSLPLAFLGLVAGFAAPVLIATGSGNHVALFAYYALLDLALFAIAWSKDWRVLNLCGFLFTYAIATAWGVLAWRPELFASTEPFLLVFFAIWLAVPVLNAVRRGERRDLLDGTLVFGNPLVAFALQAALLEGDRLPLAYSALALAALYALLAWRLRGRARLLGDAFAVLATGFATLAVPLALSARVTASTFALEGAALIWLGLRQARRLPQASGLALQVLAALAFAFSLVSGPAAAALPVANANCISALLIAAAAFASAWLFHRSGRRVGIALALYLWALCWWTGTGLAEIDRFVLSTQQPPAWLAFAALTAALAAEAARRTRSGAPAWTAALALAAGVVLTGAFAAIDARPFAGWGLAAWAAYAVGGTFALWRLRDQDGRALAFAHMGWLWSWTAALALALDQVAGDLRLGSGWHAAAALLPLLLASALALLRPSWLAPPLPGSRFAVHRSALLATQGAAAVVAFALLLFHPGDSAPLPWLPLINPLELVQLALLAVLGRWLADPLAPRDPAARRHAVLAACTFAFATAATLRAVHQLGGVSWDASLWTSSLAQAALTVTWSALGVAGWLVGSRRRRRTLWLAGALLMGVVLAKLLLVDRGHLGNLFGIASFIAYGLLCTAVGYFAPAPPRAAPVEAAA